MTVGAAWAHGLSPVVLWHLRELINPLDTPSTLRFNQERYTRLYAAPQALWGMVIDRYALFQRLRRRESETEAAHRNRQARWLRNRRASGLAPGTMRPDESTNLGTWVALPKELEGSSLELELKISPTARAFVVDINADEDWLLAHISNLLRRERQAAGIEALQHRGKERQASSQRSEFRDLLRSIKEHRIVPLWDLQIAGLAADKLATARALFPETADPARNVSRRSVSRVLLQKIERARELQDQILGWAPRLLAAVG